MEQAERLQRMVTILLGEQDVWKQTPAPQTEDDLFHLWRSLVNIREPKPISWEYLGIQDDFLQELLQRRGIVKLEDTESCGNGLYLWQGDITRIAADAIVNAANSGLTGCYCPCHGCIDNCIHTFAGIQLRKECSDRMKQQGHPEPAGQAKMTKGYCLPAKYVLHTVGPMVQGHVSQKDKTQLADCYRACLELAVRKGLQSIAFCCISTGEFLFPNLLAAEIAVEAVKQSLAAYKTEIQVIFNVFKDEDYAIYKGLLP